MRARASLHAAANPVPGGALVRVAGERIEDVLAFIRATLAPLTALLGEDPWARRW
ncbi:hypothetical protein [Chondromyces apiculatus]|uniref:Uncharacterized protein n=1 Tax=Chondromyces apiculatus DSM 436 TaxID=1192034 RepID=A0A017SVJ6_9BACT|nr:hypothetical protein [Chondromyces apiculatus]EYF00984.1 Hypothetical protein CAP_8852 [Chondromyces apiculatus DSM 436]